MMYHVVDKYSNPFVTLESIAYDNHGFPHKKLRNGKIVNGKIIATRGVTKLPHGWTWKNKIRKVI